MSTQPSFVRCPYCRHKLEKVPKRKTNCPECSKPIYVRSGDLLREDELDQGTVSAKKPTPKKPAAKKKESTSQSAAKKKPRPKKPRAQGQLAADLKRKKKEKYGPDDLLAGLQLLLKIAGTLLAGGGLGKVLGSLFGGGTSSGATRSVDGLAGLVQSVDGHELLQTASEAYTSLNEEEQFQMRAVVAWIQNGFQFPADETTA